MRYRALQLKIAGVILALHLLSGLLVALIVFTLLLLHVPLMTWMLRSPLVFLAICMMASFILSCMVMPIVVKYILLPMKRLNDAMIRIEEGDFSARVPVPPGEGDYVALYSSFNRMATELEGTELFRKDFINNFSHEFKTPIVSVRGFAKQLQIDESLSEEQKREYIDFIVTESDRLSRLSNNILLLTKLENQQYVTEQSEFYIDEQIRHTLLLLERQWGEKQLELQLDMEEILYETDESILSHVWVNLLSNAIKFSPVGGELRIELKQEGEWIVARISDEGPGVAPEEAERIFDKFYQSDSSHKTEGNGLGLSLVKRIAVLLGATITLESEIGKGSTFIFSLPAKMNNLVESVELLSEVKDQNTRA